MVFQRVYQCQIQPQVVYMSSKILQLTVAHCSYLDIYISQNIRLYFKQAYRPGLHMIIFIWKFISIIPIFLLFFAGVVKSTAFCTLLLLFQRGWYVWVTFFHQIATQTCQLIGIAAIAATVQKAADLTTPAKNRRKMGITDVNFQIKIIIILVCRLVWNRPSKSPLQSLIFCEM